MPARFAVWLVAWLLLGGCVSPAILPYKRPLLVPAYTAKTLATHGSWLWLYSGDLSGDGRADLLLVGMREILVFVAHGNGLPLDATWRLVPPYPILGFAVSANGRHRPWLVVVTTHNVLWWDGLAPQATQEITRCDNTSLPYVPYGRLSLFHDLDANGIEELLLPQRAGHEWQAHLYVWQGMFRASKTILPLGHADSAWPPSLYVWPEKDACEIWVEEAQGLAIHTLDRETLLPAAPSRMLHWPRENDSDASGDSVHLLAVGQMNDKGAAELVVGNRELSRLWLIADRTQVLPLALPEMIVLGATVTESDGDSRQAVAVVGIRYPELGESLWRYFTTGHMPLHLCAYVFAGERVGFSAQPATVVQKTLWLPYAARHRKVCQQVAVACEDFDNDGLLDGVYLDESGCLRMWYNLYNRPAGQLYDLGDRLLTPLYQQLSRVYTPARRPDIVLSLPSAKDFWRVESSVLRHYAQDSALVFHYRALPWENDKIVVIAGKAHVKTADR
jgi:hypothetical protein